MARRAFLKQTTVAAAGLAAGASSAQQPATPAAQQPATPARRQPATAGRPPSFAYPRVFQGRQLAMIAFPLGGVAAGSISLGGRGQLRDWEIFNRADKGNSPSYAFPSIWVQAGKGKPVARVLEARILPPYEGPTGLGTQNAPGLPRFASATFTGEFPLAQIEFRDRWVPVTVTLEAFTPFVPHDADDSGLPVAFLRYRVANPGPEAASVAIAFSVDNPLRSTGPDTRQNEHVVGRAIEGILMSNPSLPADDFFKGGLVLGLLNGPPESRRVTFWRGWPAGRWWNSPMLFWDDFREDGELGPEPQARNTVGSLCVKQTIAPRATAEFTFLLAWHFPNRTPRRCGWQAPRGEENTVIGNYYSQRFSSATEAAEYAVANLERLEQYTRRFAANLRESTLPAAVKDAASANLSTLVANTCFRTADGEFHAFEGVNDRSGCCFGSCTHVWNYETATAHLFPSLARSLRRAAFGYSMDDAGAIHFRQLLPEGKARSGFAAADGQMGQVIHACLDWILSGDTDWLRDLWPRVKKALEFAWVPGGWDADRDGVMEGVQHNTYDVEFYGPNPECGIYYLGALRAAEEMAHAVDDTSSAAEYRRLFDNGSKWIDANLFNGEYYIQRVQGVEKDKIAPALRSSMGSDDTVNPEYQVGDGCLLDQLIGQYLAEVAGLGPLVKPENIARTLESIYRYNYKPSLATHDSLARTFVLNDESALVICDYAKGKRPRIPFPYYAEAWTGFEHAVAAHMLYAGMLREGAECIGNTRARYDGEKRNPWNEAECGHHYARAMAAWSGLLALSGFRYHGPRAEVIALPRVMEGARPAAATARGDFRCFWSTGTGWGSFTASEARSSFVLRVDFGTLPCRSCRIRAGAGKPVATLNEKPLASKVQFEGREALFSFDERVVLREGDRLALAIRR